MLSSVKRLHSYRMVAGMLMLVAARAEAQQLGAFVSAGYEVPLPFRKTLPGVDPVIIADIVGKATYTTPWGTFTEPVNGKFWHSRDGKSREDDDQGNSLIYVRPREIWLDHRLKTAMIGYCIGPDGTACRWEDGSNLWRLQDPLSVRHGTMGGREVVARTNADQWWDFRTGILLQVKLKTRTVEIVRQLTNIEERDPDPELFKIPEGYAVTNCAPESSKKSKPELPASCPPGVPTKPPK